MSISDILRELADRIDANGVKAWGVNTNSSSEEITMSDGIPLTYPKLIPSRYVNIIISMTVPR